MKTSEKILIIELALKYLESDITDQEFRELEAAVASSQAAADYYTNCVANYFLISEKLENHHLESDEHITETINEFANPFAGSNVSGGKYLTIDEISERDCLTKAMRELLEMEKNSPVVDIPRAKPEPDPRVIHKVDYSNISNPRGPGPSKFQLFITFASAACLMVIIGIAYMIPDPVERPIVAKLVDSIKAEWDSRLQVPGNDGSLKQSRYSLKSGYSSILLNDGVDIIVEAPAEFSLMGGGTVELFRGKIHAVVPDNAHGFTVITGDSKIVDLGTEFGVEVDDGNNTEVHVTKGEVLLFTGSQKNDYSKSNVSSGQAKKVYNDGFVTDIALKRDKFASQIDSKKGTILIGESIITVVDDLLPDNWGKGHRHDGFYESADPDAKKGLTVSVYEGKYDPDVNYDLREPLIKKSGYNYGFVRADETFKIDFPEKNPAADYTYVINGFIELPESGKYKFKAGWDIYKYNKMELNGRQVYRHNLGEKNAIYEIVDIKAGKRYPVKITYFSGTYGSAFWYKCIE